MAVGKLALPVSASGGGGGGTFTRTLRTYTSGTTWTKPSGLQFVDVWCLGGGGGGGAGSTAATSVAARGGAGGGGPMLVYHRIEASALASTVAITIGAGGNGGAGHSASTTVGATGGNGGNTSFGSHIIAPGGFGGTASTGGVARTVNEATPANGFFVLGGSTGRNSSSTGGAGTAGYNNQLTPDGTQYAYCTLGGPSGGGVLSSNSFTIGGSSNRYWLLNVTQTASVLGGQLAGSAGGAGLANAVNRMLSEALRTAGATLTVGTSGGGGAGGVTANGGNGGAAGNYGGAGAGGGGARNGFTSGSGGSGSGGLCYVLEYTA